MIYNKLTKACSIVLCVLFCSLLLAVMIMEFNKNYVLMGRDELTQQIEQNKQEAVDAYIAENDGIIVKEIVVLDGSLYDMMTTRINRLFHDSDIYYLISTSGDKLSNIMYYTIYVKNIDTIYETRNLEFEAVINELSAAVQNEWLSEGYKKDACILVSGDNPELIYFSSTNGEIDYSRFIDYSFEEDLENFQ